MTGGVLLHADKEVGVVGQVVGAGDGGVLGHDDDLDARGIRVGEADVLLALVVDRDAGEAHVDLAGLDGGDDGAEVHVLDLELEAELVGDEGGHVGVDADDLVAIIVLVGREGGIGAHDELALLDGLELGCLVISGEGGAGAGEHAHCEAGCEGGAEAAA